MMAGSGVLDPSDVGVILSYQCQASCAHCLYNCGPHWQDWMSFETVEKALQATRIWGHSYQVHLTGGEPFLNYPLLRHAVQVADSLNIPCYVETNAGWCVRPDQVAESLQTLDSDGLDAILISCSPFHAEKIPPKRTLMAIDIAMQVFGPHRVIVYLPDWLEQITRFDIDRPAPLNRYSEAFGERAAGVLLWEGYRLISGGRSGYELGHLVPGHPIESFQGERCFEDILFAHHSHLDLYGNFISGFCGGLSMGDWEHLPQILGRYRMGDYSDLFEILIHMGPYGLFASYGEQTGYQPRPEGYAGKCHLCVDLRKHLSEVGEFSELQPTGFYGMF